MPKNRFESLRSYPRHRFSIIFLAIIILLRIALALVQGDFDIVTSLDHILLIVIIALLVHLADHYLLWKDVINMNRTTLDELRREQNLLLDSVTESGITKVYRSRFAARKDIRNAIQNKAPKRIWLLGVGLNVIIELDKLIKDLERARKANADVRVMMLDAFRSTAVFRTFLESDSDHVGRTLKHYEQSTSDPIDKTLYFTSRLCSKFEYICGRLRGSKILLGSVKFYAHTPLCWMVIVDDEIYFQPYTFGTLPQPIRKLYLGDKGKSDEFTEPDMETIGDLMPVFRFEDVNEGSPFRVLVDHYRKLWSTSDEDLFHILPRQLNKEALVKKIFAERGTWLKHVYGAIHSRRKPYEHEPYDSKSEKYRKFTRKICPTVIDVTFTTSGQGTPLIKTAQIYDFSRYGIGLEVNSGTDGLQTGDEIVIERKLDGHEGIKDSQSTLATFFSKEMLGSQHPYIVKHKHKTNNRMGCKMQLDGQQ